MNLIGAFMLIFLVAGAGVAFFASAAAAPQTPFIDTFGNAPTAQSNNTQTQIQTAAPPVFGGEIILLVFVCVCFIILLAVVIVFKPGAPRVLSGRR